MFLMPHNTLHSITLPFVKWPWLWCSLALSQRIQFIIQWISRLDMHICEASVVRIVSGFFSPWLYFYVARLEFCHARVWLIRPCPLTLNCWITSVIYKTGISEELFETCMQSCIKRSKHNFRVIPLVLGIFVVCVYIHYLHIHLF